MGASCSAPNKRSRGSIKPNRNLQVASTHHDSSSNADANKRSQGRKIHPLKNADGSINDAWPRDAGGKIRFKGILCESAELTEKEADVVLKPVFDILGRDKVRQHCSYDLLLRCVRGYVNNTPDDKKWQALIPQFGAHVASIAEGMSRVIDFRSRSDVQADGLLSRRLPNSDEFHRMWPMCISGYDVHGHIPNHNPNHVADVYLRLRCPWTYR